MHGRGHSCPLLRPHHRTVPQRDPLEDITGAPYSYAGNDPIDNSDPCGLCNKNPLSGGFWTQGNCLSSGATYVYNVDRSYYSCHWRGILGQTLIDAGTVLGWASSAVPDNPVSAIAGGIATVWSADGTYVKTGSRTDAECSLVNNGLQNLAGVLGGPPTRIIIYGTIGNSLCDPDPAN